MGLLTVIVVPGLALLLAAPKEKPMPTLTLIAYKSSSEDYYGGYCYGRSESAHRVFFSTSPEAVAEVWAEVLTEPREGWEAEYEVTLLVNGAPPTEEHAALVAEIEERRDQHAQALRTKRAEADAERERQRAAKEAEAERARELAQLRKLAEKHGLLSFTTEPEPKKTW